MIRTAAAVSVLPVTGGEFTKVSIWRYRSANRSFPRKAGGSPWQGKIRATDAMSSCCIRTVIGQDMPIFRPSRQGKGNGWAKIKGLVSAEKQATRITSG